MTKPLRIGSLSRGGSGRHQPLTRIELETPTRVCNSASKETYKPPVWNTRSGSLDHLNHQSKGIRA